MNDALSCSLIFIANATVEKITYTKSHKNYFRESIFFKSSDLARKNNSFHDVASNLHPPSCLILLF